jgi:hypothetical protein
MVAPKKFEHDYARLGTITLEISDRSWVRERLEKVRKLGSGEEI